MSGFVCIMHGDNAPIDQALLQSLTDFLSFRGPDALEACLDGAVGMGHALLRTTPESLTEKQPASLDERYRIVADARLDAREDLIAQLQQVRRGVDSNTPDCDLILHSYAAWGTSCVDHLRGDFSFALWDARHKQLFCARDHFGVKPLYYANFGSLLVVSNTLNCIRRHPAVSGQLNDLAIADFLLFDMIREPEATSFGDIRRLPPAHTLICERGATFVRRYWTLPVSEPLQQQKPGECVEQFRELLDRAVADRMRTNRVGVLMSGGLDSPTIAASAKRTLSHNGACAELRAYTDVYEHLIPHEERHYATLVAKALEIPIEFHISDKVGLGDSLSREDRSWPEPLHSPGSDGGLGQLQQASARNRVVLTGFGGDPALSCLLSVHFVNLLKNRKVGQALGEAMRYIAADGRFSRLYVRVRWRKWFGAKGQIAHYPGWLNPDLEDDLGLRGRWETSTASPTPNGTARRSAYEAMEDLSWPNLFEGYDPGVTGIPVEVRHPFFDLRLVTFLLALPALPWCSDKELLRVAAQGMLPDVVRLRRKSPLLADPMIVLLQQKESDWVDSFVPVPELRRYVMRERVPRVLGEKDPWTAWVHLRPLSLNFWLRFNAAKG